MKNFYISDLHFGHDNIINYDNRPFNDVIEMNEMLIFYWNQVVSPEDTVYILGDMVMSKYEEDWIKILERLVGKKFLILGNHDIKQISNELRKRFIGIERIHEITDGDKHVIMCHYPIPCYRCSHKEDFWMLYGHVHVTKENDYIEQWTKQLVKEKQEGGFNYGHLMNVGCMMPWMNYIPRRLDEIIKAYNQKYLR